MLLYKLYVLNVHALSQPQTDTVYYLVDTAKVPVHNRMWEITTETTFKYFSIKCPCLQYGGQPTFIHKANDKGHVISKKEAALLKPVTLAVLINDGKRFIENGFKGYTFYFLEPQGGSYLMHRMGMTPNEKPWRSDDAISVKDSIRKPE